MPVFRYEGLDAAGKRVKGVEDADSSQGVRAKLRKQGIFPTEVEEERASSAETQGSRLARINVELFTRVNPREIALSVRQLGTLLKAGMPLVAALNALIEQGEGNHLARVLTLVREAVNGGASLAEALSAHPRVFSPLMVNMVRAGEAGGALDVVLARLAQLLETQTTLRGRVQSALAYPVVMMTIGLGVVVFLLVKVVPSVAKIFTDMRAELPTPTLVLMAVSHFLEHRWWVIFLLIGLVVVGLRLWGRTAVGRHALDRFKLRIPLFGVLIRKVVVARFASTLSTLMASGVPLLAGLDIVKSIVLNRIFEEAVAAVRAHVQEGGGIASGLRATGEFPAIVLHMVDVGERSGSLEEMLDRVAAAYEEDVTVTVSALTSLVEPVMIVILGLLVLFIVLAILLPIFEINELIK